MLRAAVLLVVLAGCGDDIEVTEVSPIVCDDDLGVRRCIWPGRGIAYLDPPDWAPGCVANGDSVEVTDALCEALATR
jgi:hypothetical protein